MSVGKKKVYNIESKLLYLYKVQCLVFLFRGSEVKGIRRCLLLLWRILCFYIAFMLRHYSCVSGYLLVWIK